MSELNQYFSNSTISFVKILPKTSLLTKILMKKIFKDKKDLAGKAYYGHLKRVAKVFRGNTKKIALLHDILEDTGITKEDLQDLGYNNLIITSVDILTRKEGETYQDYINRIISSDNKFAMAVKMSDLLDNMDLSRLKKVTDRDIKRFHKYEKSYEKISAAMSSK